MVSIERLLERFGHKEYTPYGDCICVPGSEWVEKWQEDLKTMGYEYIRTDFGNPNRPVYLIQLKERDIPEGSTKESSKEEKENPPEKKGDYKRGRWLEKDKQKLLKLMAAAPGSVEEKAKSILNEFPGRPLDALLRQYAKLVPTASTQELPPGSTEEEKTEEPATHEEKTESKPKEKKKRRARKEEHPGQEPGGEAKTNLTCNLAIHIEAKSAASIKAVITLLKELK